MRMGERTGGVQPVGKRRAARRRILQALAALALTPALKPVLAGAPPPGEAVVISLMTEVWASREEADAGARLARLRRAIEASTDLPLLSRLVLGRYWRRLDAGRQAEFQALFRTVVIAALARRLEGYIRDLDGVLEDHFRLHGSQPAGERDVIVQSRVRPANGPALAVAWRLRDHAILDLVVEGVSLLITQRAEFATVIERRDVDGLLADLRARAAAEG
jgi:phospholipid transport system substrate-binding protein